MEWEEIQQEREQFPKEGQLSKEEQSPKEGQLSKEEQSPKEEPKQRTYGLEFKIGVGALSGIGILFVLTALTIMVKNFAPPVIQGMLMFSFFAVLWLLSQLVVSNFFPKLALGLSGAGIAGLYLSAAVNYYYFDTLTREWAIGVLVLVGLISWCVGFVTKSSVLQCASFVGYFLCSLCLPWGQGRTAFACSVAVLIGLNLLWHFGIPGKRTWVRMAHCISYVVYVLSYEMVLLVRQPEGGLSLVLLYGVVAAILLNVMDASSIRGVEFASMHRGAGDFCAWLCGMVFQTAMLAGIALCLYLEGEYTIPLLLLVVVAGNLFLLVLKRFQRRWLGYYYQAMGLLLLLAIGGVKWPELIAGILLFGLGLFWIRENVLLHEIILTVYGCILLLAIVPRGFQAPALFAFLLGFTLLCQYVPHLRGDREAIFVYINVSLMGSALLAALQWREAGTIGTAMDIVLLLLAVAAVFLVWRDRFHLPGKLQGVVLSSVLTYGLLFYPILFPVAVSVLLMVIAIASIVVGFLRRELALRIYGLCLSLFVCGKVVFYDYWDLDLLSKSILLLAVGLIAIAISVIYGVIEYLGKKRAHKPQLESSDGFWTDPSDSP